MKRSFLTALGIEKNIIDTILDEYNLELETAREKSKEIAADYQLKLDQLNEKLKNSSPVDHSEELEGMKEKYNELKNNFDSYKKEIEVKEDTANKISLISKQLEQEKVNQQLIPLLLKEFQVEDIQIENGTIQNWDVLFAPIQQNYAAFIGADTTIGSNIATPPANEPAMPNPFKKDENGHRNLAKQIELYKKDPVLAKKLAAEANYKL